jgi:PAS domain S-box-containing protein
MKGTYQNYIDNSKYEIIHDKGRIMAVSRGVLKLFNAEKREDILNNSIFEYISPDSMARIMERMALIAEGNTDRLDYEKVKLLNADGKEFFCEIMSEIIEIEGKKYTKVVFRECANN